MENSSEKLNNKDTKSKPTETEEGKIYTQFDWEVMKEREKKEKNKKSIL